MKHKELKIPLTLARRILSDKRHPQLRVLLAAKGLYGGFVKKKDFDARKVADLCDLSTTQAVMYHMDKLLEWNWVGQDEKHYFFRPIKFLCEEYDVNPKSKGYVLDLTKELPSLQEVLFCMAVKRLISFRRYAEANNGAYQQADANGYTLQHYKKHTLSVRLLGKLLGLSVNMVHRLKKSAQKLRYLSIRHNSRRVMRFEHNYLFEFHHEKLFSKDGVVRLRLADELKPFIFAK